MERGGGKEPGEMSGGVSRAAVRRPRLGVATGSLAGFMALALASWIYVIADADSGLVELFQARTWERVGAFLGAMFGAGNPSPAFLSAEEWGKTLGLAVETLTMSVLAIGLAAAAALLTFLPAARNVAFGELSGSRGRLGGAMFFAFRAIFAVTRGIPELLWAMLIVFIFSPGLLPGALALGLHNYGILSKLSAEVVEDLDPRPARALRSAGASNFQMLMYGVMPQVLPQFLTYLLYRWEVVIRTTIVVGFVAAGGLGREFRLAMSWFHYDKVTLLLACYLGLVVMVDLAAAGLRRLAR